MNVLFVCTGNTCRSAMAEGMFKKMLADRKVEGVEVHSCGTGAAKTYRVPPIVLRLMEERDVDLSKHRPTKITMQAVDEADIVLVMDGYHLRYLQTYYPQASEKTFLLKEYIGAGKNVEIFDPIGQPDQVYTLTCEEIEACLKKLLKIVLASLED